MKEYVSKSDLDLINFILERGADVKIRRTDKIVSIQSVDLKTMSKKNLEDLDEMK